MKYQPFYDPNKTFEDNYKYGPFGLFADRKIFKDKYEPKNDFLGHKVYLPFGIAAGPLYNGRFVKAALDKGFDIVTHKTVRPGFFPCNPFPNVLGLSSIKGKLTLSQAKKGVVAASKYKTPLNIINSFNNPSFEPDVWQKDLKSILKYLKKGQVLSCSLEAIPNENFKSFLDSWVRGARLIKETGTDIIELNTSCPNAGKSNLLCFDVERMKIIAEKVKNEIGSAKLVIKIAYFENTKNLSDLLKATGKIADAYAVINTIQAKIIDSDGNPLLNDKFRKGMAGASGDCVRWLGLDMVKRLNSFREKNRMNYKIIGMSGVMNASHYKLYKKTGADAVMSVTAAMWNPYLAQEIKKSTIL